MLGYLDEIYIYRRALLEREIEQYLENPNGDSQLQPDSNLVYTESYTERPSSDSLSDINTNSVWFSQPTSHLTNMPLPKTPNSTLVYMDQVGKPTDATVVVSAVRPASLTTKEPQTTPVTTLKAHETTATTTEKPGNQSTKTTTLPPTKSTKKPMLPTARLTTNANYRSICKPGNVYRNRDLVGGLGAGNFTDKGTVLSIDECMKICCGMKDCSVAYMVEHNCFAISCKEKQQCKTFIKNPLENSPVIGFVDRYKPGGKLIFVQGINIENCLLELTS